jgi:hypothetical protein
MFCTEKCMMRCETFPFRADPVTLCEESNQHAAVGAASSLTASDILISLCWPPLGAWPGVNEVLTLRPAVEVTILDRRPQRCERHPACRAIARPQVLRAPFGARFGAARGVAVGASAAGAKAGDYVQVGRDHRFKCVMGGREAMCGCG